ncbi:sulfotransferase family protein [Crossiella sp. NPDC003009]
MNPFQIEDLANPRPNPRIAPMLRQVVAAGGPPLRPDALLTEACDRTGLSDFGDPRFREPLEVLCTSLRTEAALSQAGAVGQADGLVQLLRDRLLLQELLRRHPEIAEEPVDRPIVIAGLPRTGTTHLHRLLAAVPGSRSLPYWEAVEPVPDPAERPGARQARAERALEFLDLALPHLKRMHQWTAHGAEEEVRLLAIDFSSTYFECQLPLPGYRDWYLGTDQTPAYAHLRVVLQALSWLRGDGRWVLKAPQHLEQLPALHAAFPDAVVVFTHRDPGLAIASLVTMATYTARLTLREVDVPAVAGYWTDRVDHLLARLLADQAVFPVERRVHVRFADLVRDPLGVVTRIHAAAGLPEDPAVSAAVREYLRDHPRDRHGRMRYDPVALGLDPARRSPVVAAYQSEFEAV